MTAKCAKDIIRYPSNRPPEDWFSVFPDPVVGGAVMDRLVSSAVKIIVTSSRSYRKDGSAWQA